MPCLWNDPTNSRPQSGIKVVAKYNITRSDIPFQYVISSYDGNWKTEYMNNGRLTETTLPTPNWWALIEHEEDHA